MEGGLVYRLLKPVVPWVAYSTGFMDLQALLAVADTCSNTGCLSPEEALQVARERYELARGRLSAPAQGDTPRCTLDASSGTPRASPRASRPGTFGGVSKLTAQQRRARHRCNNPW